MLPFPLFASTPSHVPMASAVPPHAMTRWLGCLAACALLSLGMIICTLMMAPAVARTRACRPSCSCRLRGAGLPHIPDIVLEGFDGPGTFTLVEVKTFDPAGDTHIERGSPHGSGRRIGPAGGRVPRPKSARGGSTSPSSFCRPLARRADTPLLGAACAWQTCMKLNLTGNVSN